MGKRVTSQDVANRAGVSRSVVSAILNGTQGIRVSEEKRQAVLQAIDELGYRVDVQARAMRTGKSRCIGAYGNLDNALFLQVLQGAQRVCTEKGYQLLLYGRSGAPGEREGLLDLYRERRIDGLITKDKTGYDDEIWAGMVHAAGLPFVSVEGFPEREDLQSVLMDYRESILRALDYMWSRTGLPPVYAVIYHSHPDELNWGDLKRLQAYKDWMEIKGLQPEIICLQFDAGCGDSADALRFLENRKRPVSVLSSWFSGCSMLYRAAYRAGWRIGQDLHVMSADNTMQAAGVLVPSLTAVEVPYVEMGAAAADRVISVIEGDIPDQGSTKIWIPARMILRESV
jgi:LacI family transcriptional regulator